MEFETFAGVKGDYYGSYISPSHLLWTTKRKIPLGDFFSNGVDFCSFILFFPAFNVNRYKWPVFEFFGKDFFDLFDFFEVLVIERRVWTQI